MRYWDSSAIVPLLVRQPDSASVAALIGEDPEMIVAWSTPVECASAVARLRREGYLDLHDEARILTTLRELGDEWAEVLPTEPVRRHALRLLRTHPLRAADALQLAAALTWADQPQGDAFVTFDARLAAAAALEGFTPVPRAAS
ncbi:MAG: type II toxin-antitoxin system VapC family toxin [Gemmatimonadota bacterium]